MTYLCPVKHYMNENFVILDLSFCMVSGRFTFCATRLRAQRDSQEESDVLTKAMVHSPNSIETFTAMAMPQVIGPGFLISRGGFHIE